MAVAPVQCPRCGTLSVADVRDFICDGGASRLYDDFKPVCLAPGREALRLARCEVRGARSGGAAGNEGHGAARELISLHRITDVSCGRVTICTEVSAFVGYGLGQGKAYSYAASFVCSSFSTLANTLSIVASSQAPPEALTMNTVPRSVGLIR